MLKRNDKSVLTTGLGPLVNRRPKLMTTDTTLEERSRKYQSWEIVKIIRVIKIYPINKLHLKEYSFQ